MPGDVFPRVAHNRRRLRKAAIWKMRSLSLVLVGSAAICASGFVAPVGKPAATTRGGRTVVKMGLFDGLFGGGYDPAREQQKEEDFRAQQEILRQRQNPQAQAKYFNEVNKRRQEVSNNVNEKFNLAKGGKDPIIKWMELKKAGKIPDREKYEGVEDKSGIVIPTVPFGLPKYDNGERFDLRLPYVDDGYVDPDASLGATFSRLFSGPTQGRKPTRIPTDIPSSSSSSSKPTTKKSTPPKKGDTPPPPPPAPKKIGWW